VKVGEVQNALIEQLVVISGVPSHVFGQNCGNHIHADLNASRNIANKYLEQQSA